jgi:IS30 family transposase
LHSRTRSKRQAGLHSKLTESYFHEQISKFSLGFAQKKISKPKIYQGVEQVQKQKWNKTLHTAHTTSKPRAQKKEEKSTKHKTKTIVASRVHTPGFH